jgi:hypothetical protein
MKWFVSKDVSTGAPFYGTMIPISTFLLLILSLILTLSGASVVPLTDHDEYEHSGCDLGQGVRVTFEIPTALKRGANIDCDRSIVLQDLVQDELTFVIFSLSKYGDIYTPEDYWINGLFVKRNK